MKRLALLLMLMAVLVATSSIALAAPQKYTYDPAHTRVTFSVRHIFSKVPGRFKDFTGHILLDQENLTASSAELVIQTASIDTDNEKRDNHLRSADFFDAATNPTITFKSAKIEAAGEKKFKLSGDLSMNGITKPVTLDVTFLGSTPFGIGGRSMGAKAGFEVTGVLNRKDWDIVWNRTLDQGSTLLGDEVYLDIQVEADLEQVAAAEKPKEAAKEAPKETKTDKK